MEYICYIRTSTKSQTNGLEAQRNSIDQFLKSYDGVQIAEYCEMESGSKDNRIELQKALAHCKKIKATLLVSKLDRVSRRVSFIATLMESSISLKVAEMPNSDTFQLHIYAALAEQERQMISQRTKAALAVKKAQGVILGRGDKEKVALEAKTFAQSLVPHVEQLAEQGIKTMYGIAKALNEMGVTSRSGGKWQANQVQRTLSYL